MKTVDELMNEAFHAGRVARSQEYKAGVRALLELRINDAAIVHVHRIGTAAFDAFCSGMDEGNAIWTGELEAAQEG